jgi:hypothetical protein
LNLHVALSLSRLHPSAMCFYTYTLRIQKKLFFCSDLVADPHIRMNCLAALHQHSRHSVVNIFPPRSYHYWANGEITDAVSSAFSIERPPKGPHEGHPYIVALHPYHHITSTSSRFVQVAGGERKLGGCASQLASLHRREFTSMRQD